MRQMNKNKIYLSKIKMKNYKSIKNLEIDFHPDLNIIIGKNGSGKTNVLKLAYMSLRSIFNDVENDFETEIEIKDKDSLFQLHSAKKNKPIELEDILRSEKRDDYSVQLNIFDNENNLKKEINEIDSIQGKLYGLSILIGHGLPKGHLYFFEEPFSFNFSKRDANEIKEVIRDGHTPDFIRSFAIHYHFFYLSRYGEFITKEIIRNDIYDFLNKNYRLNFKHILSKFSEIEDVRLNKGLFVNEVDKETFSVKNIYFEFKIHNKWLPFSYLSDGLQRTVIILSEIAFEQIQDNERYKEERAILRQKIILLEEPELGIHPHFLFKLMTFLKEAGQKYQIILSTHSPEILDHLNKDELDRIIICTNKDDYGTRLKHLSETEIKEAQDYMEDLDLSDYWKHADLER